MAFLNQLLLLSYATLIYFLVVKTVQSLLAFLPGERTPGFLLNRVFPLTDFLVYLVFGVLVLNITWRSLFFRLSPVASFVTSFVFFLLGVVDGFQEVVQEYTDLRSDFRAAGLPSCLKIRAYKRRLYGLFLTVPAYLCMPLVSTVFDNSLVKALLLLVRWTYEAPVIGWVARILALWLLLGYVRRAIILTVVVLRKTQPGTTNEH